MWTFLFFHSASETCLWIGQISWPNTVPRIIDPAFLQYIKGGMSTSGDVNVLQRKNDSLFSARGVWLVVQRDGGTWGLPKWTRDHFVLHRHPEMNLEKICRWRPFSVSQEVMITFSSNSLIPYQSGRCQCLLFHLRWTPHHIRKYHVFCLESGSMDFWCVQLFQFLKIHYNAKKNSRVRFRSKLKDSWLIFIGSWMIFYQRTKWNGRSFMVSQNVLRVVSSHQSICLGYFAESSRIPSNPHTNFIQTRLQQYSRRPFLYSAYCSFSNPICFWTV